MQIKSKKLLSVTLALTLIVSAFLFPIQVQAVPIQQQLISKNRSYRALQPQGLVIHDTCAPGGTAQNNRDYFNRVYVSSSAHYFVDWTKVIQCIPNSERAWHAGPYANARYLGIEMCDPKSGNQGQFNTMYKYTVELAAQLCKQYGWSSSNIVSHRYISYTYHETDHEDPIAFLQKYGKTWDILLTDIQKAINGKSANVVTTQPVQATANSSIATLQAELNRQGLSNLVVDNIAGPKTLESCPLLKQGSRGNITKWVQRKVGVKADGYFGKATRVAVINFQKAHGLTTDGVVGKNTWVSLLR